MACNLKSLVNKQKIQVESSQEFKMRKLQAATFLNLERLPVMNFNDQHRTLNGERVWHCLIKQLEDETTATGGTVHSTQVNDQLNNHKKISFDSSLSDVLANLSIDISRFNASFTPNLLSYSDNNNQSNDHSVNESKPRLLSRSDNNNESSDHSLGEGNKSLLTDQSAVFADSVFL